MRIVAGSRARTATIADRVAQVARWAAAQERPSVVCPPVATFMTDRSAAVDNMANGLAISVDVDKADPRVARRVLTGLLGPPTVVVNAGNVWVDPRTGKSVPKIHMHWRLSEPTTTPAEHAKLRETRHLAALRVGADPSLKSPVHPIRWPGTLNRKATPALAAIEVIDAGCEAHLDAALDRLREAVEAMGRDHDARAAQRALAARPRQAGTASGAP